MQPAVAREWELRCATGQGTAVMKRIRTTDTTLRPIRDTARPLGRLDPAQVQQALGAEEAPGALAAALAPLTLFALREEPDMWRLVFLVLVAFFGGACGNIG